MHHDPEDVVRFLGRLEIGDFAEGDPILESFRLASRDKKRLRFLRLAGPKTFRNAVQQNAQLLLDPNIPAVEFLLADPFGAPFLRRMDVEMKDATEIWRVRNDIVSFAERLVGLAKSNEAIGVAFHRSDIIWNLCLIGDDIAVVRAYHGPGTGHDASVEVLTLAEGARVRLAESFVEYYESVKRSENTRFVFSSAELQHLGPWPSLFKGNNVYADARRGDCLVKVLMTPEAQEAESAWLSAHTRNLRYLRPVPLDAKQVDDQRSKGGHGIRLRSVPGVTAHQLLLAVQQCAARSAETMGCAEYVVSAVARQAFDALREFRSLWTTEGTSTAALPLCAKPYPWRAKLRDAVTEALPLLVRDRVCIGGCLEEIDGLTERIELHLGTPFRDAQLKNRLIKLDDAALEDVQGWVVKTLLAMPEADVDKWLQEHTWDIDFETGCYLVTEWDDPLHILWADGLGYSSDTIASAGEDLLKAWLGIEDDQPGVRLITSFCRTLREACRRLWYAQVMPNTFATRYRDEDPSRVLRLAFGFAERIAPTKHLLEALSTCIRAWPPMTDRRDVLTVVARPPVRPPSARQRPYDVFIAYSRRDSGLVDRLKNAIELKGFSVFVDRVDVRGGQAFPEMVAAAIKESRVVIALLTENGIASDWVEREVHFAVESHKPLIPVCVDPASLPDRLKLPLGPRTRLDCAGRPFDALFDELWKAVAAVLQTPV